MPRKSTGDYPNLPGVYMITNIVNRYFYIGSAIDVSKRICGHIYYLRGNRHHNPKLQASWNKYGENSFLFSVLETVGAADLLKAEQKWFDHYSVGKRKDCYNIHSIPYSTLGRKHSAATKIRMSEAQKKANRSPERKKISGDTLRKYNLSLKGVPKSEEHKRKISESNKGKIISEKQRGLISIRSTGKPNSRRKAVIQLSLGGSFIKEFPSVTEASKSTRTARSSIYFCINGHLKSVGNFMWKVKDEKK